MVTLFRVDADKACYNVCDVKCKAGQGNMSNLRKHLVKHKIYLELMSDRLAVVGTGLGVDREVGRGFILCRG